MTRILLYLVMYIYIPILCCANKDDLNYHEKFNEYATETNKIVIQFKIF